MHPDRRTPLILLLATAAVLVWSFIGCYDPFTWLLEVLPVLIGIPFLIWLYPRFRFTNLVYTLIAIHAAILMIGGHYTYERMPLFEWLKQAWHLDRNYYDRLGHIAQGFIPAMIAREVLLRRTPLERNWLLNLLVFSICMCISALYELAEFAAARLGGAASDAFLGTQGDPWDTQWDMTCCMISALTAMILLSRLHDRALQRLR